MNEEETELYRAAISEFYKVYNPLRKKYNLRLNSHFSIYGDGHIEIWQYEGGERKRCICWVNERDDIEVYKRAEQIMREFGKHQEERGQVAYEKSAG